MIYNSVVGESHHWWRAAQKNVSIIRLRMREIFASYPYLYFLDIYLFVCAACADTNCVSFQNIEVLESNDVDIHINLEKKTRNKTDYMIFMCVLLLKFSLHHQ